MEKIGLPEPFLRRMRELLGANFGDFAAEYEKEPSRALRINSLYGFDPVNAGERFAALFCELAPVPFDSGSYYFESPPEIKPGNDPLHHAGAFYIQEPSAMSPVSAVPIRPDMKILDLCASPGGKSIQAALRAPDGVIVCNEIIPNRARTLLSNTERTGLKNAIVTDTDTATLAKWYDSLFDLVICDAPCSGEGMFRKNPEAVSEWSPENVKMCAERQRGILDNAANTVAADGYLLYSTCTFSLEENEMQIDSFLHRHPEFELCEVEGEVIDHTVPGVLFPGCRHSEITRCRRFYPHISRGEGQFFALMRKPEGGEGAVNYKSSAKAPSKADLEAVRAFFKDTLGSSEYEFSLHDGHICILPGFPVPPYATFGAGVFAGTIQKGRIEPHHQLFKAFGQDLLRKIELSPEEAVRYLRGETLPVDSQNGWAAVTVCGVPLGGGKVVSGILKNHYPKGLRIPPK